jgi:Tfp pilus assembly protein PilX
VLKSLKRARDDSGFTLVTVMISMTILTLFVVSAWGAVNLDTAFGRGDQDRKRAFEAAQAGIEWYAYQLARDPAVWERCATGVTLSSGAPAPIKLEGDPSPNAWATVTNAQGIAKTQEQWRLEILKTRNPLTGATSSCSTSSPATTALQDGSLRIRATGRANGRYRSIIGTFRRKGFVDYIYFTQWETQDPIISGVREDCNLPRSRRSTNCVVIQFQNADRIQGPMHTNDESIVTCGSPTYGRPGKSDKFEVSGNPPGYISANGCGTSTPVFNGPKVLPAASLGLPDGNTKLATLATPDWTFTGQTCLNFHGNQVDVFTNQNWSNTHQVTCSINNGGRMETRNLTGAGAPPNGVIYVQSNGGSCTYSKYENYDNSSTCGDVAVQGSYSQSITIGSANDIVINGNITKSGDQMMGLVAANFVRVYHPAGRTSSSCGTTPAGYTAPSQIDAAILALAHSFVVDNYDCGSPLGGLQVNGAIAQYYRGTVGTGSGTTISTGYAKDYNYDDRLKYRSPPNFLDPVQTRWDVVRQTEQKPAQLTP